MKLEVAKQLIGLVVENCGTPLSKAGYKRLLEELVKLEAKNHKLQNTTSTSGDIQDLGDIEIEDGLDV